MKKLFLYITLSFSLLAFAQNEQLAQYYYEKGDFEKAKIGFEELLQKVPQNTQYFLRTIDCYQQLQQFDIAEKAIKERFDKYKQSNLLVPLLNNAVDGLMYIRIADIPESTMKPVMEEFQKELERKLHEKEE